MNQTTATLPLPFGLGNASFNRFREILPSQDQKALDDLLEAFAANPRASTQMVAPISIEHLLIALLLEQQKTLQFLISRLNYYDHKLYLRRVQTVPGEVEALSGNHRF